ncbi:MarR family transcriptional regulator [Enterococcus cecorum]|uniref:MarR family winged helix-turn-helix transcriptional regulator n=1 Tax=Enterococcus cecorum TaxID=44008 RepID=UPI001FAD82DB|nr:MarR family transcriptional regulator [Enterococcus cecorum]MCJ0571165.1 MarR family transcriptional regulator [Enterococcus cecorum]MCJ0585382.1 MarR family transcriptional regulator [Enterococcus cecorum]MCJ0587443.1 MarR family transcriptional regulator [Enterococcus cecorum]MCJ0590163.1 MarR family transcriptional regulator [Enterococcus cecorum]MCJ0591620.1 MarR family transcriptional regulator [Enterococcus cecorum]
MSAEILRSIGRIARALDSIANVEFKENALNRGQYLYLVRIFEHPGIILEELSLMVCVDKTTASRAVNKLVKQGLVQKQSDEKSVNRKFLTVTKTGEKLAKLILQENDYSEQKALQGLNPEQILQLKELLTIVDENIFKEYCQVKSGKIRDYLEE